ncbi:MAG: FAD-binding oxidoreductase [Acetobacteraceae bacterium]|nr:FAD-binding oxidoreductase [Acetobacteraceae bacterium]
MLDHTQTGELLSAFEAILGDRGILQGRDTEPYCRDWRDLYRGATIAVLRPADTAELAAVVGLCASRGVAMVPQGGNTSMVGGAVPDEAGAQVVVSLARLNRLRDLDPVDMTMVVEAGVPWQAAQAHAASAGLMLPLSISSEGTAQVGGILSTNAGGNNTLRYGNARDLVLGIEAVLPDGSTLHALRRLRKDNTGYALRHLLVGAEGTLGFITAAVLKLVPRPTETAVALCGVPSPEAATELFRHFQRHDAAAIQAFEFMSGMGMSFVIEHIPGATLPLASPAPHYVLVELATTRPDAGLRQSLESVLETALETGLVEDAAIAESGAQRDAIWKLREEHAEAQKREGASVKNDVSVPIARVAEMIARASAACRAMIPGVRPVPFGHLGDGNIHFNLEQPVDMAAADFLARSDDIMHAVNDIVRDLGGSFSAEHGVGRLKTSMMPEWRGGAELETMRRIKAALDPMGLMNPGKLFPA